ncbi:tetratricopeptide repeat protein [Flavobacterium daemonense]|uniref:tetratricopeptide repeat protein n=1 Tax=Flavobacterium daemonense TaxID=1393049 RepID=UPI001184FD08|nr:hypothetical protein [Flavobacterium daemonense]KAF2335011.1 hypothetical protein FND99_07290 [Flavobacterium daemonense]
MKIIGNKKTKAELNWLIVFIFFFIQNGFSQTKEIDELMANGEKAYSENKFLLAKEIYSKVTNVIPNDKNGWYNLGASELELGDNENACEHFYQAFLLNDGEALKLIKTHCPNFRNGSIMSIEDVEEKPKFVYKGKEYLLIENNNINPKFTQILVRKFQSSRFLYDNFRGHLLVRFTVTANDSLSLEIIRVEGDEKKRPAIKAEINSIFNTMVKYVSAKNKGVNVDLFEKWGIPLDSR